MRYFQSTHYSKKRKYFMLTILIRPIILSERIGMD